MVDIAEKVREARLRWYEHVIRRDEGELVRDILWWSGSEDDVRWLILQRRRGKQGWDVIRRNEGEIVTRDIIKWRNQKIWGGGHYREDEGNKVEMIWTCNKKRWRRACQRHSRMKRPEDVGWKTCRMSEARLKLYENVTK